MPFISVQSQTFPFLQLDGMSTAAAWGAGKLYKIGLVSRFVRVTSRGLQYAVQHGGDDIFVRPSREWWQAAPCALVADGLCEQQGRDGGSMLLFPTTKVDVPDQITDIPGYASIGYLREIAETNRSCVNMQANREVVLRDSRYELSLCDLHDNELDLVLDWSTEELFWRIGGNSTVFYAFIAFAGIYLVSQLADNVKSILEPCGDEAEEEHAEARHGWLLAYIGVVLASFVFLAVNFVPTWRILLTEDDVIMFWVLNLFVALHTVLFLKDEWPEVRKISSWLPLASVPYPLGESGTEKCHKLHRSVRGVSFLTSFLLVLAVHVHSSFSNPYSWLLVTLFGIRSVHKMLKVVSAHKAVPLAQRLLHVWDFFVFLSLLTFVVVAGRESLESAAIGVFETVFFCVSAGFLLCLKTMSSGSLE